MFEQPSTHNGGNPAFVIPDQSQPLTSFIVPIDDIEKRAGVDFFPELATAIQDIIEPVKATDLWNETGQ